MPDLSLHNYHSYHLLTPTANRYYAVISENSVYSWDSKEVGEGERALPFTIPVHNPLKYWKSPPQKFENLLLE